MVRANPRPAVLAGSTADLLITIPVAYYFLVVRRGVQPALTLAPVICAGLLRASFLLPTGHLLKAALAGSCEAALAIFIGTRIYIAFRSAQSPDVVEQLRQSARSIIPVARLADAVAFELAIIYYSLFSWRAKPHVPSGARALTLHRESGFAALLGILAVLSVVESALVHLVVQRWSIAAAWALTIVSLYGAVALVAIARSLVLRPVLLFDESIVIRCGLLWSIEIPAASISTVRRAMAPFPVRGTRGYLRATGGSDPKWIIELREAVTAEGMYGIRKRVTMVGLHLDSGQEFEHRFAK